MVAELGNKNRVIFNLVYNAMLICDSARPVSCEAMFQGLRFSYSLIWDALNVTNQGVDPLQNFLIGILPIKIFVPGMFGEYQLQSVSSLSVPLPDSSSAIDSSSRRAFLGLLSR